jgi:hypothetical protein
VDRLRGEDALVGALWWAEVASNGTGRLLTRSLAGRGRSGTDCGGDAHGCCWGSGFGQLAVRRIVMLELLAGDVAGMGAALVPITAAMSRSARYTESSPARTSTLLVVGSVIPLTLGVRWQCLVWASCGMLRRTEPWRCCIQCGAPVRGNSGDRPHSARAGRRDDRPGPLDVDHCLQRRRSGPP